MENKEGHFGSLLAYELRHSIYLGWLAFATLNVRTRNIASNMVQMAYCSPKYQNDIQSLISHTRS